MRFFTKLEILLPAAVFLSEVTVNAEENAVHDTPVVEISVNVGQEFQQMDNFGASDCWTFQYIGSNWPQKARKRIADLLFSQEFDKNGNPRGIGLSMWRFNIGAGSADNPSNVISNIWRTTECFADSTFHFDFKDKQRGQVRFLKEAKKRGCDNFLGFCNSAPWFMTRNRQATNIGGLPYEYNLPKENYDVFVDFISEVCLGLDEIHGIRLDYVSPFNEPEWEWQGTGQEGSPASVSEIAEIVRLLGMEFQNRQIGTEIIFPESGSYEYLYSQDAKHSRIGNQIDCFFATDSDTFVGDVPGMAGIVAAHSYWTGHQGKLVPVREKVAEKVSQYDLKLWQSEVCIMSNDKEIGGGAGRDMTMQQALYVARIIHHDIVTAGASAWQWWTAVSPEEYKDGLIFVDKDIDGSGNVYVPKMLWAFGNYSRFIRPGAVRVGASSSSEDVLVSSYRNADGSYVTVIQNHAYNDTCVHLKGMVSDEMSGYLTSDTPEDDMRFIQMDADNIRMPARSILTIVLENDF